MRKAYWIKCDLDGRGEKWELAVEINGDEDGEMYSFPFVEFEDYQENYEDHFKKEIERPTS